MPGPGVSNLLSSEDVVSSIRAFDNFWFINAMSYSQIYGKLTYVVSNFVLHADKHFQLGAAHYSLLLIYS